MLFRASTGLAMLVALLQVHLGPEICRAQQAKVTIEDILEVWKERQDKFKSARFELECQETIHKASTSFFMNLERGISGSPKEFEPNPLRDYLVKGTSRVSLDGSKLRYSYDHQQWDPRGKKLYPEHYVDVFDGHFFKFLQDPASGQDNHASAAVRTSNRSESALTFPILPLIFTLRGCHPQFFQDLPKFQVTGQTLRVAGHPCLELVRDHGPPGQREFLYLDQGRGYVVLKETIVFDGQPNWQLDVTYNQDPAVGWLPRSWEYIIRAGKEHHVLNSGRSTVTRYEINPGLDDSEFDISFPAGTLIHNESSGDYLLSVVQDNGEKGREVPIALNPTYEELQKAARATNRWLLVTVSATIFVLAFGGWLWLRHRRLGRILKRNPQNP